MSNWTEEALCQALDEIKEKKLSYRQAEAKYNIPKSTFGDYITEKVKIGRKQGPPTVLSKEEELHLARWTMEIGYG